MRKERHNIRFECKFQQQTINAKIARNPTVAKYPPQEIQISLIMMHRGVDAPFNYKEGRNKQKAFIQIQ